MEESDEELKQQPDQREFLTAVIQSHTGQASEDVYTAFQELTEANHAQSVLENARVGTDPESVEAFYR